MDKTLRVIGLTSGYGAAPIVDDVSFELAEGAALAVLGRNGVGKTTLLKSLLGLVTPFHGSIRLGDQAIDAERPWRRARRGLALVPQEREIFPSLTVEENLTVARRGGPWSIERVFDLLPGIARRKKNLGNRLSGGEQQMLALGRALVGNPGILLLDEPFEGLAPVIVDEIAMALSTIRAQDRLSLILVEHQVDLALELTDGALVLDRGRIVWSGASHVLKKENELLSTLIGLDEVQPES